MPHLGRFVAWVPDKSVVSRTHETDKKYTLTIRVVVGRLHTGLKPVLRHVPVVFGLALPHLLVVALGQLDRVDALSRTTRFAKRVEEFGDTVVLVRVRQIQQKKS